MSAPSMSAPVLVTGATGPHGSAVVTALLSAGYSVRALTRDTSSAKARELADAGAELAVGDLLDPATLAPAMAGVQAVYGVTTPFGGNGPKREVQQGHALITAARKAAVAWFVLASVGDADHPTGVPHFESKGEIERMLPASGLQYTIVAPTYFYENLGDPGSIAAQGELALALPADKPLQQVCLADLGSVVVAILAKRDEFLGARVDVAGDHPTPLEMAATIGEAAGRPVAFAELPLTQVERRSPDIAAMYRFLAQRGYSADSDAVRARFPEVSFTSFAEWAQDALFGPPLAA